MSYWIVLCANKYFKAFAERMKQELLILHVTQVDETPTQVIGDSVHANCKCWMWVHRSGELYKERPIVVQEYNKGREHKIPLNFYKNYKGVLVNDGLAQYHLVDNLLQNVTNSNYWVYARRAFQMQSKLQTRKILKQQS